MFRLYNKIMFNMRWHLGVANAIHMRLPWYWKLAALLMRFWDRPWLFGRQYPISVYGDHYFVGEKMGLFTWIANTIRQRREQDTYETTLRKIGERCEECGSTHVNVMILSPESFISAGYNCEDCGASYSYQRVQTVKGDEYIRL
jgi:hypothetical protein